MYRKSVTAARQAGSAPPSVSKDPVPPVDRERETPIATSAMDFCRDILSIIIKMTQDKAVLSQEQKELAAVSRRIDANQYKSVFEVKDDVLQIWRTRLRFHVFLSCTTYDFVWAIFWQSMILT